MEGEFLKQTSVYRERRGKYYFQTSFLIFLNFSHVAGVWTHLAPLVFKLAFPGGAQETEGRCWFMKNLCLREVWKAFHGPKKLSTPDLRLSPC